MDCNLLKEQLKERGVDKVGFAFLGGHLPTDLEHLQYGISIVVRLSDAVLDGINDEPTYTYFHHYRTVNAFIDQTTLWISTLIAREGYKAMPIPASQSVKIEGKEYYGIFQHKTTAVLSGLGWIGKNGLFTTPDDGSRVRLGTVLTNMELPAANSFMKSQCGGCRKCVEICPAMAIYGTEWEIGMDREKILDPWACSEYMSDHFKHIGRGVVCGLCMKVCPFGQK